MKIADVRAIRAGQFLFCRVETECGLIGWGESGAWGHLEASTAAIEKFSEYLVGQDPRTIELHWNIMQRFAHFRGNATDGAVSAIDIALWDILGQHLKVPVHQLLGGAYRKKARVYGHVYAPTIEQVLAELGRLKDKGFTAVGHLNPFLDEAEGDRWFKTQARKLKDAADNVRQFREVCGPEMDLLLEMHRRLTPAEAIEFGHLVEDCCPMWIEDPIRPEFTTEMGDVARRCITPIATGERFMGLAEFRQQIGAGPIAYARISVCVAGGITGARKIAALAEAHNIQVAPHNPISPIGLAACLQIAASAPNFAIQEYPTGFHNLSLVSDAKLLGGELVTWVPELTDGFASLPSAPGLGTAVKENASEITKPTTKRVSMRLHSDGSPIDQ